MNVHFFIVTSHRENATPRIGNVCKWRGLNRIKVQEYNDLLIIKYEATLPLQNTKGKGSFFFNELVGRNSNGVG